MKELVKMLHAGKYSCVIVTADGDTYTCNRRGVSDLYDIYRTMPSVLEGAQVADKVIGKAAAAILCLGKAKEVHAHLISKGAKELLSSHGIASDGEVEVERIFNHDRTDICPMEKSCLGLEDPLDIEQAVEAKARQMGLLA